MILFNLSGHGHFDMAAYDDYLAGKLVDHPLPDEMLTESLSKLPSQPQPA